ncbi:LOB domain-containing protein 2-like [Durio zibethinus]|uniref:LOB domain-containing protein 2-like n=1 Tax=Durio zibethinus TaxID=66656 RepID=A0A6P5X7Y8_DURZI|nr:LOB domain-containing protein 2-like [Durio zibethinus]
MSAGNAEEPLNSRHACAACKHQRKKCEKDCVFASHFPATRANYFREVHKIFGVKNATSILENLSPHDRKRAVESLEWEAFAWKEDPIQGPLGLFRKLERELELLKNQQNPQQNIVVPYQRSGLIGFNNNSAGIVADTNINATNFGYANNPNLGLDVIMNNYAGLLQRADNIENPGLDNYFPGIPNYHAIPQGQGRSVILQEEGLDAVAHETTALLPKQDLQRNQILGNSAMRPPASFNQGHHQRGSKLGRLHAYIDGSVSGSQGRVEELR